MIAMALACRPKLLIADEPTTALDVTIQAQVLELMKRIQSATNTAILLISHDLGVIADVCERVIVMYAGRVVEDGDVRSIFHRPSHPYTRGLLKSIPRLKDDRRRLFQIPGSVPLPGTVKAGCPFYSRCSLRIDRCAGEMPPMFRFGERHTAACWVTSEARSMSDVLVRAENLGKTFKARWRLHLRPCALADVRAVDGVSFEIRRGETLALVGESGCGKSTLGRLLLRLIEASEGSVFFEGTDIYALSRREMRAMRRKAQIVFQDPYGSLSPRRSVADIIAEPLEVFGLARGRKERRDRVAGLLDAGRTVAEPYGSLSASVLRRPAPAHRHRARDRGGPELHRGGRAGLCARCLGSGADRQSAPGPAGEEGLLLPVRRARPRRRPPHRGPRHGDVSRPHRRDRPESARSMRRLSIPTRKRSCRPRRSPIPTTGRAELFFEGDVPSPTRIPPGCSFHTAAR